MIFSENRYPLFRIMLYKLEIHHDVQWHVDRSRENVCLGMAAHKIAALKK